MKKRIRILSILAVIICATLAAMPAMQAAAETVRTEAGTALPEPPGPESAGSGSIIAEKAEWSQLQEGDLFYIVIRAGNMAVSLRQKNTKLDRAAVTVGHTQTHQVLTGVEEGAALFEKTDAGDGSVYLKSASGYLTSSEDGRSLFYVSAPINGSRWQAEEGETLVNADVKIDWKSQPLPLKVYVEYYPYGGYYTAYAMTEKTDWSMLIVDFYKAGNINPGEIVPEEHSYSLPVFETSDLHGMMADTSGKDALYLLAYLSDQVKKIRGYEPNTRKDLAVLLDGGDIYQGTSLSSVTNGHALSAAMDLMGYDAVTVGNHEFDWGFDMAVDPDGTMPDYSLKQFVGENKIPVIISNLYRNGEKLSGVQDYVILEKTARDADGNELPVRVGVIGMAAAYADTILYDKFTGAGFSVIVDYGAVNALAEELEESGQCDATVLLLHGQARETANRLGSDTAIDLVLGGHTHNHENWKTASGLTYLAPAAKAASYAYCEMVFSKETEQPVFREIRGSRDVVISQQENTMTDLDPEMVMLTNTAITAVNELLGAEIGYITENAVRRDYLPASGGHSSAVGNWVCSIMARMVGAEIGIINVAGMRGNFGIPEGQDRRVITLGDIYELFPFDSTACAYEITCEELKKALDYSLTDRGQYLISEMSGMTCWYLHGQILALVTGDGTVIYANGAWKDGWREKKVRVAMPLFLATTERKDDKSGLSNPFWEWRDSSRRLDIIESQVEGTIRVLTEEAAENNGYLAIDTAPHFIRGVPDFGLTAAP